MSNPTLNHNLLKNSNCDEFNSLENSSVMSINGTITKTFVLGLFMLATFAYTWYLQFTGFADKANILYHVGLFGGLGLVLFISFAPKNKSLIITTPLYAMCEGLALGYLSAIMENLFPGIALQAIGGTFVAFFSMLALYKLNIIKCTGTFRKVISVAIAAIFVLYLLQIILMHFGKNIPVLFNNGPIGIAFCAGIVIIAAFSLIIDFDNIERYSGQINQIYEWYFGFSLLVTIIWLYIEILRLLSLLRSRN